MQQASNKDQQI